MPENAQNAGLVGGNFGLGDGTTTNRLAPAPVPGLCDVVAIAAGGWGRDGHSLALRSDGTVLAWGNNRYGQLGDDNAGGRLNPLLVAGLEEVVAIAAACYNHQGHSLALTVEGTVFTWGRNEHGQLGDGTVVHRSVPVAVPGLAGVGSIAAGGWHNLALVDVGTVGKQRPAVSERRATGTAPAQVAKLRTQLHAWGANDYGQLGDGTRLQCPAPTDLPYLSTAVITEIATCYRHNLALMNNGSVRAWGRNNYGQLGDGTTTDQPAPIAVCGLSGAVAIAAGHWHNLAVMGDATVRSWGRNSNGQLGDRTLLDRAAPVPVENLADVVSVAAGPGYSLAVLSHGAVRAWGRNSYGQLGDGTITQQTSAVPGLGLASIIAVAAGGGFNLALDEDGTVYSWGYNEDGQLGSGAVNAFRVTPLPVIGLTGVTAIAAGARTALALLADGTVCAWGNNENGQLGDGTVSPFRATPLPVIGLTGVTAIASGGLDHEGHCLALLRDGTVFAWGYNEDGQLGGGTASLYRATPGPVSGLSGVTAIGAGGWHSLALTRFNYSC